MTFSFRGVTFCKFWNFTNVCPFSDFFGKLYLYRRKTKLFYFWSKFFLYFCPVCKCLFIIQPSLAWATKARKMLIFSATLRHLFYKTQWACQGAKLTQFMSIFTSKKVKNFLKEKSVDKIWSKKRQGDKSISPHAN